VCLPEGSPKKRSSSSSPTAAASGDRSMVKAKSRCSLPFECLYNGRRTMAKHLGVAEAKIYRLLPSASVRSIPGCFLSMKAEGPC